MESPGSQALEAARNMKDLVIFKKPVGVAKRHKKIQPRILDEDSYIKKMGEIIQRDFPPLGQTASTKSVFRCLGAK